MTKCKVIHAVPDLSLSAGGIASTVPALAKAMSGNDFSSSFLTLRYDDFFVLRNDAVLIKPNTSAMSESAQEAVTRIANKHVGNIVLHSHGLWHPLNHALVTSATKLRLPLVISLHGMLLPWARNNKKMRKDIAWYLYQRRDLLKADIIHVTSESEREIAEKIIKDKCFVTIPFGVDLPLSSQIANIDKGSSRTLLFLGRIHPVKNLECLIKAFYEAQIDGWLLRIVGPDEEGYKAVLHSLAQRLGVNHLVSIEEPAYGKEKEKLIEQSDVLILPSFTENFGAVVPEALSMGRPVIASTGTPWEILSQKRCGWWVSPDLNCLMLAIREMSYVKTEELMLMGERGRELVRTDYSWSSVVHKLGGVYNTLGRSQYPATIKG